MPGDNASPEIKSEGQRLFLEIEGTEADVAKKLGCKQAIVGHWRRGRRIPSEAYRYKMDLLFGIPKRAWDVAPGAKIPKKDEKINFDPMKKARKKRDHPSDDEQSDEATLEITKGQIDSVLEDLESDHLTDAAQAKLRDTLAKLLALRARLERDIEMSEDRIVREHPAWARVRSAILRALEPYPQAAQAVVEELGKINA